MCGLFASSVLLVPFYFIYTVSLSLDEAFMGVLGSTVFFFMSFMVLNSILVPVGFFIVEFLTIKCANYFISDKRVKIPLLVFAISILYYAVMTSFYMYK